VCQRKKNSQEKKQVNAAMNDVDEELKSEQIHIQKASQNTKENASSRNKNMDENGRLGENKESISSKTNAKEENILII
jgi:hypothetical protein